MIVGSREYVTGKYKLQKLKEVRGNTITCWTEPAADVPQIENYVAEAVQINVPFNNPITGFCAFTHKAGIHAKVRSLHEEHVISTKQDAQAILNNPSTYEIINPADFGMSRYVHFASRLTGWNAIKSRVEQLELKMTDEQVKLL